VSSTGDKIALLIAFVVPWGLCFEFRLVGRMNLAEVLMLCALPLAVLFYGHKLPGPSWSVLGLGLLWLAGQMFTDVVQDTPFRDYARGWAKVVVFLLLFLFLQCISEGRTGRLAALYAGVNAGSILKYLLSPTGFAVGGAVDNYWKFGLGQPVTGMVLLFLCLKSLRRRGLTGVLGCALLGTIHFLLGFRSAGLAVVATAGYLLVARQFHAARALRYRFSLLPILSAGLLAASVVWLAYGLALRLNQDLRQKHAVQSQARFGVLLGGRTEMLYSIAAILDSPVVGHGSWAKDRRFAKRDVREFGVEERHSEVEPDLIPTHSYVLGAWVEAGITGALFWVCILWLTVSSLLNAYKTDNPLLPVVAYAGFDLAWAILFSPFGTGGRLTVALGLSILVHSRYRPRRDIPAPSRDGPGSAFRYHGVFVHPDRAVSPRYSGRR
jgi:uncharacterized membrane protein